MIRPMTVLVRSLSLGNRSRTKFEHQSATEFKICTHGSEVLNCHDQRVFFPLVTIMASPLNFRRKQQEKRPSGTQGKTQELITQNACNRLPWVPEVFLELEKSVAPKVGIDQLHNL